MVKARARHLYLTSFLARTVTDSQVIGWLELMGDRGLVFDLLLLYGLRSSQDQRAVRKEKVNEAAERIRGRVYEVPMARPESVAGQVAILIGFLRILMGDILRGRPTVLQTRVASSHRALAWLKRLNPRFKVIFDCRGAVAEEYLLTASRAGCLVDPATDADYLALVRMEARMATVADSVICVSERLRQYLLEKTDSLSKEKLWVLPGSADSDRFFFDAELRSQTRTELGLEGRFVFVYSGGLDKAWQMPDFTFKLFADVLALCPQAHLLCLTPDAGIVESSRQKWGLPEESVTCRYVSYGEMGKYLCAADAGLLFREDTPTNNVASPTKFAEYLLCGLPVVISAGIGDFSSFVVDEDVGIAVQNDDPTLPTTLAALVGGSPQNQQRIAAIGRKYLSKQVHIERLLNLHRRLAGGGTA